MEKVITLSLVSGDPGIEIYGKESKFENLWGREVAFQGYLMES